MHSKFKFAGLGMALTLIAACDVAYPVAVIGENGTVFRGVATDTVMAGGQFQATNGNTVCTGQFARQVDVSNVSFPVQCSNGLSGIGKAKFENGTRGAGTVYMQDGSEWQFIFGRAAGAI